MKTFTNTNAIANAVTKGGDTNKSKEHVKIKIQYMKINTFADVLLLSLFFCAKLARITVLNIEVN